MCAAARGQACWCRRNYALSINACLLPRQGGSAKCRRAGRLQGEQRAGGGGGGKRAQAPPPAGSAPGSQLAGKRLRRSQLPAEELLGPGGAGRGELLLGFFSLLLHRRCLRVLFFSLACWLRECAGRFTPQARLAVPGLYTPSALLHCDRCSTNACSSVRALDRPHASAGGHTEPHSTQHACSVRSSLQTIAPVARRAPGMQ